MLIETKKVSRTYMGVAYLCWEYRTKKSPFSLRVVCRQKNGKGEIEYSVAEGDGRTANFKKYDRGVISLITAKDAGEMIGRYK